MNKWLLSLGIGAITVGTTVFTGGEIIDNAISYIQNASTNITNYANNENKLTRKLTELKEQKDILATDLNKLINGNEDKKEEIAKLKIEIEAKDKEIASLLEKSQNLESELQIANSKSDELGSALKKSILREPINEEEISNLTKDILYLNVGKNGNYGDNKPVNLGVVKATSYVWDSGFRIELFNTGEKTLTVRWAGRNHPLYPNHTLEISHNLGDGMAFTIEDFYYELKFLR